MKQLPPDTKHILANTNATLIVRKVMQQQI